MDAVPARTRRTVTFAARKAALEARIAHAEGRLVVLKNELFVLVEEQKKKLDAMTRELNG